MGQLISVRDQVVISACPERVWTALIEELRGKSEWWSGSNVFEADNDPAALGTRVSWAVHPNGPGQPGPVFRFASTTVEAEPNERLQVVFSGQFGGHGDFRIERHEHGTSLTFGFDVQTTGWLTALAHVVDIGAGHSEGVRRAFQKLAVRLEQPTSTSPSTEYRPLILGTTSIRQREHTVPTAYGDVVRVTESMISDQATDAGTSVLVHGWGSSAAAFDAATERLVRAGVRVVAMDLPGHGGSVLSQGGLVTLERVATAVREVIHRHGDDRTVLVGHSGGGLASVIALSSGLSCVGLVLLSTALKDAGAAPPELMIQGSPLLDVLLERHAEAVLSSTMGPTRPCASRPLTAARLKAVAPAVRRRYFECSRNVDLTRFGRSIRVPVEVLTGDEDGVVSPLAVRSSTLTIPRVRFQLLRSRGHAVPEEAPTDVAAAVLRLLGGDLAPSAAPGGDAIAL